jgi:hypothetical protein
MALKHSPVHVDTAASRIRQRDTMKKISTYLASPYSLPTCILIVGLVFSTLVYRDTGDWEWGTLSFAIFGALSWGAYYAIAKALNS